MISDISLDFDICIRKPDRFGYPSCLSELFVGYKNDDSLDCYIRIVSETIFGFSAKKEERGIQEGESMTHNCQKRKNKLNDS